MKCEKERGARSERPLAMSYDLINNTARQPRPEFRFTEPEPQAICSWRRWCGNGPPEDGIGVVGSPEFHLIRSEDKADAAGTPAKILAK